MSMCTDSLVKFGGDVLEYVQDAALGREHPTDICDRVRNYAYAQRFVVEEDGQEWLTEIGKRHLEKHGVWTHQCRPPKNYQIHS